MTGRSPSQPTWVNPLHTLVIGRQDLRPGLRDQDYPELLDAAHEDQWGRLPHEPGYGQPPAHQTPGPEPLPDRLRREVRARIDELQPAADEAGRLSQALDQLRRAA